jgi:hypothetical protein
MVAASAAAGVWRAPQLLQKAAPAGSGCLQLTQNVDCINDFPRYLSIGPRHPDVRRCKRLLLHAYYSTVESAFL